jgi:IS5 family transposase
MRLFDFTYEELAFHISDSRCLRHFCRIGFADKGFKKSALNAKIKMISEQTWEVIFRDLLGHAEDENIEKGRKVRIDCTVVESNIHKPFDSVQLFDCVRVLTRLLQKPGVTSEPESSFPTINAVRSAEWSASNMPRAIKNVSPCMKIY